MKCYEYSPQINVYCVKFTKGKYSPKVNIWLFVAAMEVKRFAEF
jgi:hypothetical protein